MVGLRGEDHGGAAEGGKEVVPVQDLADVEGVADAGEETGVAGEDLVVGRVGRWEGGGGARGGGGGGGEDGWAGGRRARWGEGRNCESSMGCYGGNWVVGGGKCWLRMWLVWGGYHYVEVAMWVSIHYLGILFARTKKGWT